MVCHTFLPSLAKDIEIMQTYEICFGNISESIGYLLS